MKKLMMMLSFTTLLLGGAQAQSAPLTGTVKIDGSSTVFPITEAIAEEYRAAQPKVRVNIGVSGTGGGFKKFTVGEIDINDASRRIKDKEKAKSAKNGIKFMEVPVAFDGLTVVINKANTWATDMTTAELKKIWDTNSKVKTWADVRKGWPNRPIKLYGPGPDSGTFDYFTKAINGKSGKSRSAYTKSEDDNVLVKGVTGDKDAMGYFGFAYYKENSDKLKSVKINGVQPTETTINNGTYKPLSRPVFIYVSDKAFKKAHVADFVNFYLKTAPEIVSEVGYVPLPAKDYKESMTKLKGLLK